LRSPLCNNGTCERSGYCIAITRRCVRDHEVVSGVSGLPHGRVGGFSHTLAANLPIERLLPHVFFVGEKVAEGRMRGRCNERDVCTCAAFSGSSWLFVLRMDSPLIRLRHLLPPQKARGEKALDGRALRRRKDVQQRYRPVRQRHTRRAATLHRRCSNATPPV
jgi:hypothetical protein